MSFLTPSEKGKRIGYVRVSTIDQNPDRQLQGLILEKRFIDYCSGKTRNRPQLRAMYEYVREDDIVFVHSMDRLGRNLKNLMDIVEEFTKKSVKVHFVKENMTFCGDDTAMSKLLFSVMGAFSEFEGAILRERQMEGIRLAQIQGRYSGRPPALSADDKQIIDMEMLTRKPLNQIARELGVGRSTIYRYLETKKKTTVELEKLCDSPRMLDGSFLLE